MKILYFATDAYGGHGGIAQYNRDVIAGLCNDDAVGSVVALVRTAPRRVGALPHKLDYRIGSRAARSLFAASALWQALRNRDAALLYCAHLNLAPLVWLASKLLGKPWMLTIYGIDAWEGRASRWRRFFAGRADLVASISKVTLDRFTRWCPIPAERTSILPNAVHLEQFGLAPRDRRLEERYGIAGRRVVMTLGRLQSYGRHKGFDAMLDAMPALAREMPDLRYMIVGSGQDRSRLAAKAAALGIADSVIFTGEIAESEKADHYRLADAFVLASRGEGFGFVLLEAMASGVPAVASSEDGGREAVRDGALGQLVDPGDTAAIVAATRRALGQPKHVPKDIAYFRYANFQARLLKTVERALATRGVALSSKSQHPQHASAATLR